MNRFMTWRRVAAFALFAFVAGIAPCAVSAATPTPDAHSGHHADATPAAATDPCVAPAGGTPMADHAMVGADMTEEFDLLFIDMMIPHHRSAVAMAEVALARGEHEEIRVLAQAIVSSQSSEVDQMTGWRDAWYPGAPMMPMDRMNKAMAALMQEMLAAAGTPSAGMGVMGGMAGTMDPQAEAQALCTASGPFDEAFLRMMIPHHRSAVAMAQVALVRGVHPEIKQPAQAIIDAQQRELAQMEGWLATWYGATPVPA